MGSSESTAITTELMVSEMRKIRQSLSDRDRRLFNHAKLAVAQETADLKNAELFLDFADREGITIRAKGVENPDGRIYVGFDENDKPKYVWERKGFWRGAKQYFVESFQALLEAFKKVLPMVAAERVTRAILVPQ